VPPAASVVAVVTTYVAGDVVAAAAAAAVAELVPVPVAAELGLVAFEAEAVAAVVAYFWDFSFSWPVAVTFASMYWHHCKLQTWELCDIMFLPSVSPFGATYSTNPAVRLVFLLAEVGHCVEENEWVSKDNP
jgi:hypothetical protein